MQTIISACEEAGRLTERLLCYAGHVPLLRRLVDPTNIIEHTLQMVEGDLLEGGIEVTRDYGDVPQVRLDNVQIGRLLRNIVRNAIDAMPRGGRLHLTCHVDGDDLVMTVRDTGIGIPAELIDRVLLPFVTTKGALSRSAQPGTGLGLCVAQGIVRRHAGEVSLQSDVGKGTTVTIRIPLAQPESPAGPEASYGTRDENKL
jgi:signal transduction histidine kinase